MDIRIALVLLVRRQKAMMRTRWVTRHPSIGSFEVAPERGTCLAQASRRDALASQCDKSVTFHEMQETKGCLADKQTATLE